MSDDPHAAYLNNLAVALQSQGRFTESLEAFKEALRAYEKSGDVKGQGRCANGVGAVLKDLGQLEPALAFLERALVLRRQANDKRGEAITLSTLGPVYQDRGQPDRARVALERALDMCRSLGDRPREGQAAFNLGMVCSAMGQSGAAVQWLETAAAIAAEVADETELNKCLNALGSKLTQLGRHTEAIKHCQASLAVWRAMGNSPGEAAALHNLGLIHESLGEPRAALDYLMASVRIEHATGYSDLSASTLCLISWIYLNHLRQPALAQEAAERAAAVAVKTGHVPIQAAALRLRAAVCVELNQCEEGRRFAEGALALSQAAGDVVGQCEALNLFASLHHQDDENHEAVRYLEKALALIRHTDNEMALVVTLHNLGSCLRKDRVADGVPYFEEAIKHLDRLRRRLDDLHLKTSFFNRYDAQNPYYVYVATLIQLYRQHGDLELRDRTFLISEKRRARPLLDLLFSSPRGASSDGDTASAEPLTLDAAKNRLAELQDAVLLTYSVHEHESYLWAVTGADAELFILPSAAELGSAVSSLSSSLASNDAGLFAEKAHTLYRMLIQPAESLIGARRLIIAADSLLHGVPFEMLVRAPIVKPALPRAMHGWWRSAAQTRFSDLDFVVKSHVVSYVNSATMGAALSDRRRSRPHDGPGKFLGFAPVTFHGARPRLLELPATQREIEEIAKLFPKSNAVVNTGVDATRTAFLTCPLAEYRFVHIATHGVLEEGDRASCSVVFHATNPQDRLLRTHEVLQLELNADLVVLSACNTGVGRLTYGDGFIGLIRAFLVAGAGAVCASLWNVSDVITASLMHRMYMNLLQRDVAVATALRLAKLEIMSDERHASPRYWAPFVLLGGLR